MVTFSPEEQYAQVTLTYIIDNVYLHAAKVDEIRKRYSDQARSLLEAGAEEGSGAARLSELMRNEEDAVPLFSVPKSTKARRKPEAQEDRKSVV